MQPQSGNKEIQRTKSLSPRIINYPARFFSLPLGNRRDGQASARRTMSDNRATYQTSSTPSSPVPPEGKCLTIPKLPKIPKIPSFSRGRSSNSDIPSISSSLERDRDGEVEVLTRACRVRVNIIGAKDLKKKARDPDSKVIAVKLKVEHRSRLSKELRLGAVEENGIVKVNQSFTFDIKDPERAVLSVQVVTKTRFGGEESLGLCPEIRISELLDDRIADVETTKWYDLFSKKRKRKMPGKVLMDVVAGIADPEHKISLFIGTWNVGNARPPKDLSLWIPADNSHDLIIVGSQECDYQPRQPFSECGKDWFTSLKSAVGSRYKLICATSRSQLRLAAFVRDDAEKAISEIDSGSEATGVGHVVANKGAVCVSFKFWDTDLCFVNSHFAAHVGYRDARNSNYKEIVDNLSVGYQGMTILSKFHHVFWMGDLNYRLDFGPSEDKGLSPLRSVWQQVIDEIDRSNYAQLLQHDELRKEMADSKAFYGFTEGEITFPPTFKVLREDLASYNEKRLPAWCDRILWRSFDGCNAELNCYSSCPAVTTSDHKPVFATMSLTAYALPCNQLDQDDRRWHIQFTALEACDLLAADMNGFSDPYVTFVGANLLTDFHSKVKYRTLNPVWDPSKDLPKVAFSTTSLQRLKHEYLMCHVLDYDYASANDTLGYGAIPLAAVVGAFKRNPEESAPFTIQLLHHGLPAGVLKGWMRLTNERSLIRQKSSFDSLFVRTLTFRKSFKKALFAKQHS